MTEKYDEYWGKADESNEGWIDTGLIQVGPYKVNPSTKNKRLNPYTIRNTIKADYTKNRGIDHRRFCKLTTKSFSDEFGRRYKLDHERDDENESTGEGLFEPGYSNLPETIRMYVMKNNKKAKEDGNVESSSFPLEGQIVTLWVDSVGNAKQHLKEFKVLEVFSNGKSVIGIVIGKFVN